MFAENIKKLNEGDTILVFNSNTYKFDRRKIEQVFTYKTSKYFKIEGIENPLSIFDISSTTSVDKNHEPIDKFRYLSKEKAYKVKRERLQSAKRNLGISQLQGKQVLITNVTVKSDVENMTYLTTANIYGSVVSTYIKDGNKSYKDDNIHNAFDYTDKEGNHYIVKVELQGYVIFSASDINTNVCGYPTKVILSSESQIKIRPENMKTSDFLKDEIEKTIKDIYRNIRFLDR